MTQVKKISELTPELVDLAAFDDVELTEDETKLALFKARQEKCAKIKHSEYLKKLYEKREFVKKTAEELLDGVKNLPGFILDSYNETIVWNLCLYFSGDVRCPYEAKKGLMMYGPAGCGKTTLMNYFRFNQVSSYAVISTRTISYDYGKFGMEAIHRFRSLLPTSDISLTYGQQEIGVCFDDLGTEVDKKHYGNESNVMAEIILNRYDRHKELAGKTHVTTNLNTTELEERYGYRVRSRAREMFNVVIFDDKATDRRK